MAESSRRSIQGASFTSQNNHHHVFVFFSLPAGDATLSSGIPDQSVGELYSRIVTLQTEIENLQENSQKLLDEKDERQRHLDVLKEQIELLKTIKADKEDLEEALADKADACAINRKVSHDQFDAACDDLSRGIEDALSKLTQQVIADSGSCKIG